jgi:hypothetical protein
MNHVNDHAVLVGVEIHTRWRSRLAVIAAMGRQAWQRL